MGSIGLRSLNVNRRINYIACWVFIGRNGKNNKFQARQFIFILTLVLPRILNKDTNRAPD
jgi:hypothetical protein